MFWSFKRNYFGERKILNKQRVNELIRNSCLDEPFTIFDDWFRYISIDEGAFTEILKNIKKPFPDLLLHQKPNSKFALHLSAGVDSALLAFLYDNESADYLVGTVEGASDIEYVIAKSFVESANLKGKLHHVVVSPSEAFNVAREILPLLKEPLMDPAIILSYIVSRKAKELGHHLVVTGDGADAAFGFPSFGSADLMTLAIWKTIEPAEMLGLKTLLPYSLPILQTWAKNNITEEERKNKIVLRDFARSVGLPQIVIEKKKMGWVGHEAWCVREVFETMQEGINNSAFFKVLNGNVSQSSREKIFRRYSLIKWLEHNCSNDVAIKEESVVSSYTVTNKKTNPKQWVPLEVLRKIYSIYKRVKITRSNY